MTEPHTSRRPPTHTRWDGRPARRRGGFTLVELLVAIALVAFLMVGVGQIFRTVGELTSTGTALAEVEQMARGIERQMRDDFQSLSAMNSEDTFIAIRMREVGDVNRNKALDKDEIAVYLSQEDRDADNRDIGDGVLDGPYDVGSRAVTVRLDEIAFLAQPLAGGFESFEQGEFGGTGVTSTVARIYYGHGLRPPRDPNWPPEDPDDPASPRIPQRLYFPDGDFAQGPTQFQDADDAKNRFVDTLGSEYTAPGFSTTDFENATGRNEFAGAWPLTRQALLLSGGGVAGPPGTALAPAVFGNSREYTPYIRDLETINRFWGVKGPGPFNFGLDHLGPRSGRLDANNTSDTFPPAARLILHGRTDICAQNLEDVKRWLQGEPWPTDGTVPVPFEQQSAKPFIEGRFTGEAIEDGYTTTSAVAFSNPEFTNPTTGPRAALWQRPDPTVSAPTPYLRTREGVRAAILGTLTRLLVEDDPTFLDRSRDQQAVNYPIENFEPPTDPADAFMDQHAILTSRCSNFEIAWRLADPDWPRVTDPNGIDFDNDGTPELREGDPVWIDITPTDQTATGGGVDDDRSTVRNWLLNLDPSGQLTGAPPNFGASPGAAGGFNPEQPELGYQDWRNLDGDHLASNIFGQAVLDKADTSTSGPSGQDGSLPAYNPDLSMGAPEGQKEYLAVWPFHAANVTGDGFAPAPFPKNIQIRVRMTLHDRQNRLKGGKTFEFVFTVSPGD